MGDPGIYSIGFYRYGGLGDGLVASAIVAGIREKYPDSVITGYLAGSPKVIFSGNRDVNRIISIDYPAVYPSAYEDLLRNKYPCDMWFDVKPIPRIFVQEGMEYPKEWEKELEGLRLGYIDSCRYLSKYNMRQIDFICSVLGLPVKKPVWARYKREYGEYVTLCNEAWGEAPIKTYPFWEEVLRYVRYPVIQIGEFAASTIQGCENRAGKLTLDQACRLVSGARYHLGIEGFYNHFCEAVGVPRIIVFGPTPASFFGYSSAINVCGECGDCWWSTKDWMLRCPKGFGLEERPCMQGLQEKIIQGIETLNINDL